jgi:3-oxoacyl-[acyl-carrier protein] reductase
MSESDAVPSCRVVLVSGASRGLGLAIVTDLIAHGVAVGGFARSVTTRLGRLADEHPDRVVVGAVDATDPEAVRDFLGRVESGLGPIDGVVNNAAIGQDSLHAHTAADRIERIIETNLTAPLLLIRAVVRRVVARGGTGRIVNVSSICAQRGFPGLAAYSAAKGGLDAATRALARELGGRVLVNAVAPGFFASEMSAVLGSAQLDQIVRRTPSGRLTTPGEVVPVVRMLLRDQTNINGQVLVVDGGAGS